MSSQHVYLALRLFVILCVVCFVYGAEPWSWDNTSPIGPDKWGTIPGYEDCAAPNQSPIDLFTAPVPPSPRSFMNTFPPQGVPTVAYTYGASGIRIDFSPLQLSLVGQVLPEVWYLDHCRFYAPAMHLYNGKRPALERQCWFKESDRVQRVSQGTPYTNLAISTLYFVGSGTNDALIANLALGMTNGQGSGTLPAKIDLNLSNSTFYSYIGSDVVPPCEMTQWFVQAQAETISQASLNIFKGVLSPASQSSGSDQRYRPNQDRGGRSIRAHRFFNRNAEL